MNVPAQCILALVLWYILIDSNGYMKPGVATACACYRIDVRW